MSNRKKRFNNVIRFIFVSKEIISSKCDYLEIVNIFQS
jgi:hypothetical protein